MHIGLIFWVLMLLWVIFGLVLSWPTGPSAGYHVYFPVGGNLLLFILLLLLGWKTFGSPIKDSKE